MQPKTTKDQRPQKVTAEVARMMAHDPGAAWTLARRAVRKHAVHAPLWHAMGLAGGRAGHHAEAVLALKRASQLAPQDAGIWTDLCNAQRRLGATDAAVEAGRHAVSLAPDLAAAHNNLGAALRQAKALPEAEAALLRARSLAPDIADIHNNLGNVLKDAMRYDDAEIAYREALRLRPAYAQALVNLGGTYVEMGRWNEAVATCRQALSLAPGLAEAHRNLGAAHYWAGNLRQARSALEEANRLAPQDPIARKLLALTLIEAGDLDAASGLLIDGLKRDRPPAGTATNHSLLLTVTRTKLRHDAQQIALLETLDLVPPEARKARKDIEAVLDGVDSDPIDLRKHNVGKAASFANHVLYVDPAPALPGNVLSPELDPTAIEGQFAQSEAGFVTVEDMLRSEALDSLRRFCERSTIWFQSNFAGEVGTSMINGFAAPLIFQIARDLKRTFPAIFGPHMFQACWAYRYYEDQSGLALHTDAATVSMNLWITPDEANLKPEHGGLVFWNRRGPKDFFTRPMAEKTAILDAIAAEPGARAEAVPYRCNRALIFGAGIVHRTDAFSFKDGYADRRMNVTFLFGPPA